jgi:hypothetical protein
MELSCNYKNCNFKDKANIVYRHIHLNHSNDYPFKIKCIHPNCNFVFQKYSKFKSHMKQHSGSNHAPHDPNVVFVCKIDECEKNFKDKQMFLKHFYKHVISYSDFAERHNNKKLSCCFSNCGYKITKLTLYRAHVSSYHRNKEPQKYFVEENLENAATYFNDDNNNNLHQDYDNNNNTNNNIDIQSSIQSANNDQLSIKNELKQFLMKTFMKYNNYYLIPKYITDNIMEDMLQMTLLTKEILSSQIDHWNNTYNTSPTTDNIMILVRDYLNRNDTEIDRAFKETSSYSTNNWLLKSGFLINSVQVTLAQNEHFQYVPIIGTLKSLFKNQSFKNKYFECCDKLMNSPSKSSFFSSLNFKNNLLYHSSPYSLQIKLYLDEFGIVNPLGDSRKKLNMTGIYFKVNNFDLKYQARNYTTYLVALVETTVIKKHGIPLILKDFIEDMKTLETDGFNISFNGSKWNLKGTICYCVGDSLASNGIGGFIKCFNKNVNGNYI